MEDINIAVWVLVSARTAKTLTDKDGRTIFWIEESDMRVFANSVANVYELEFYYSDENKSCMVEYSDDMVVCGLK